MTMTKSTYYVQSFGRDCLGNISGYAVMRPDGQCHKAFFGDLYETGSFERAKEQALEERDRMNGES